MKKIKQHKKTRYTVSSHTSLTLVLLLTSGGACAENYFNPSFLSDDPSAVASLSRFEKNDAQVPGVYRVDIYVNDSFVKTRDVRFSNASGDHNNGLQSCLTSQDLKTLGVNVNSIPGLQQVKPDACVDLANAIPESQESLDFEKLRLNLSFPQAVLANNARGYIPPEQWDEGINALLLNYNFNGSNSFGDNGDSSNEFLSLQSGLNLGAWRLRDNATWNYSHSEYSGSQSDWQHVSTYAQRTIVPLNGELTLGDTYTPGDIFNSLSLRGAQLASDDNMLPDSLKGFAPTVRGIAKSNARVTIQQNGYTIYQTYVSPGPFVINDLYPTSSSGDLQITIAENNGSTQSYTVPYSAVPLLQREGRIKYSLSVGEYRSGNNNQENPDFGQGTLMWGLPKGYTVYGGSQFSDDYFSMALGVGKNMGNWGAISIDGTQAESTLVDDSKHSGQSWRFLYAKSLTEWGTNVQVMGYRYSTEGFYTLDETTYKRMDGFNVQTDSEDGTETTYSDYYNLYNAKKGKVQVNISQKIWATGSLFFNLSQENYWNTDEKNTLMQAGYSGSAWDVNYNFSWSYNKAPEQDTADQIFALNLSLPLGRWLSTGNSGGDITKSNGNSMYATSNTSSDNHGKLSQQAGVSGTLLRDNNLSYSVTEGYGNHDEGNSGSADLNYQGGYGNVTAGYNYSQGYRQATYGLSGGVIAHRNGLTLSQPLGDTNVLVAAPGAEGVDVLNSTGVKTDWRGYAVVPYATTYRNNRIALDTTTFNSHTDVDDPVVNVVPTQGALVRANFNARVGVRALLTLQHNGKTLPFGSFVSTENGDNTGIVGDNGVLYMSGLPLSGTLKSQWGNAAAEHCSVRYSLPEDALTKSLSYATLNCQ
jgi:outer membrane usher protein